jgi:subtilisin family serine protease
MTVNTATGMIAVEYSGTLDARAKSLAVSREASVGARLMREKSYTTIGRYLRILHVTPGTESSAIAALRTQSGVVEASVTGTARRIETVSQRYFTNDPYYTGFKQATLVAAGEPGASSTYEVAPYEESTSVPGQWGDHAVSLDYAQEYSQSGNGSGITNSGALGSSNVAIAIIDTGADTTHPELSGKVTRQRCYITDPSGQQSTSNYSVDQFGHGTDVAGIAAANANNSLGFTGTGGNVSIYSYRIFPTPDDNCAPGDTAGNNDSQCSTTSLDIASAVDDAVSAGASVINLSLGGGVCNGTTDPDATEGAAIANAIANNVVVVAATGNEGTQGVSAPACDSGVIAVGASGLSDGVATGTNSAATGSASSPVEYVASYSQYGSPAAAAGSTSAWGIVAPGGDPNSTTDEGENLDEFHWIENIWTSTPYMASSTDQTFAGSCTADLGAVESATVDCRTLIAGTSQATPLVAGAAALIISANSSYKSPAKMKQLLFANAHDIGDPHEGAGRLDIYRAMAMAVGDPSPPASQ